MCDTRRHVAARAQTHRSSIPPHHLVMTVSWRVLLWFVYRAQSGHVLLPSVSANDYVACSEPLWQAVHNWSASFALKCDCDVLGGLTLCDCIRRFGGGPVLARRALSAVVLCAYVRVRVRCFYGRNEKNETEIDRYILGERACVS